MVWNEERCSPICVQMSDLCKSQSGTPETIWSASIARNPRMKVGADVDGFGDQVTKDQEGS